MQFDEIIGQDRLKKHVRTMVDSGRIAHAQLYTGAGGVGKLALALAMSQYIMCNDRHDGRACGVCASCRKFATLEHPDLHFVFPIYSSSSNGNPRCDDLVKDFRKEIIANPYITTEEWMAKVSEGKQCLIYANESEEIIRKLSYKAYESDYKVMIIFGAEKMNEVCSNKVLKILEEPPGDTVFMLISDTTDKMLATITSRCQQIQVPPISHDDMVDAIKSRYNIPESEVEYYAKNAMGSWSKLLNIIDESEESTTHFELFKEMMRSSYSCNVPQLRRWSEDVASMGRDSQVRFLQMAQRLIRENFLLRLERDELNYMNMKENEFAQKFSAFIHERNVMDIMEALSDAEARVAQNGNAKIVFLYLGLSMYGMLRKQRR